MSRFVKLGIIAALSSTFASVGASSVDHGIVFSLDEQSASMQFSNLAPKAVYIDLYGWGGAPLVSSEQQLQSGHYPMFSVTVGTRSAAGARFGISTSDADQAQWLRENCGAGWNDFGNPVYDICEEVLL